MNILVNLNDDVIKKYKLNSDECLFLSWLINFYNSGYGRYIRDNDKSYIWLTYNKIIDDLKSLNYSKRQLARMISRLVNVGLIERIVKNRNKLYICPNFDRLDNNEFESQKCLTVEDLVEIDGMQVGQKSQPIIKYNKNYIKILINNERVCELDENDFLETIKDKLNGKLCKVAFDCIFHISSVHLIVHKMIILRVGCVTLVQNNEEIFKQAIMDTIRELTSKKA